MSFFGLLRESFRQSLWKGWAVFGVATNLIPVVIGVIQHRYQSLAAVGWMKWIAEYQAEIQLSSGLIVVAAYLIYAPYRIQKRQIAAGKSERDRMLNEANESRSQSDSTISA